MPQIFTTSEIARPQYYDRQPVPIVASFLSSGVVPHALTTRASYSPAYPYAAFIEAITLQVIRQSAAAAQSYQEAFVFFLPYYGGTYQLLPCTGYSNVPGNVTQQNMSDYGYMAYGDTLQLKTSDPSTGGTGSYSVLLKGTEFLY